MGERRFSLYQHDSDKDGQRQVAVEAALELICASVGSAAEEKISLDSELSNLAKYADKIQQALVVK